ncbi:Mss4-like protein [Dendryphion nanum]|uniref:Mss4-like protein n=1 Tax=Dendryphion nanum TaxID=256645 RepID=A0A9P9EDI8_9PLEO|nr:Mss4-like protein [Dendryphion nanum]
MSESIKTLSVSCHCGTNTHTFQAPLTSLPLATNLCNCNISRRISGSLLTSYINITHPTISNPIPPKPVLSSLTPYKSSSVLTRHFCSTCGTHMYLEYHDDGHFEVATGTLQAERTDDLVDFKSIMWISDTIDGGASHFITHISSKELPRYLQGNEFTNTPQTSLYWNSSPNSPSPPTHRLTPIPAHCHCTGVQFWITPPDSSSYTATSPYPDLLIPYNSPVSSGNPSNEPWWLPTPTHYLAGTCTCHSCRRASGFDIIFWAFIPTSNIFQDAGCTIPFSRNDGKYWGSMKRYESSAGVARTFCGSCGANVFWDGRETLVDVAVGLLDAEDGTRAEERLVWCAERVSFGEEGVHRGLVGGLESGLRVWGKRDRDLIEDEGRQQD